MWQWTHDWLKLRREQSALRHGRLIDLFYDDDVYIFVRQEAKDAADIVMIALNRSANSKEISFSTARFGPGFEHLFLHPLIGRPEAILEKKSVSITLPPQSALAYVVRGARAGSN